MELRSSNTMPDLLSIDQPFSSMNSTLRAPEKPLSENYIRVMVVKGIEKMFNMLWYHLYKIMMDIENRRRYVMNEKVENEQNLLLNYTKKAVTLWKMKSSLPESLVTDEAKDEKAIKSIETEVRSLKLEVEFLDTVDINSRSAENTDAHQSKNATKYKERVLEALGMKDVEPVSYVSSVINDSQPLPRELSAVRQVSEHESQQVKNPIKRSEKNQIATAGKKMQSIELPVRPKEALKPKRLMTVAPFSPTAGLEDIKPGSLFGDATLLKSHYFSQTTSPANERNKGANLRKKQVKLGEGFETPLTNYAQTTGKLTAEQTNERFLKDRELKDEMEKVSSRIFGKSRMTKTTACWSTAKQKRIRRLESQISDRLAKTDVGEIEKLASMQKLASTGKGITRRAESSANKFYRKGEESKPKPTPIFRRQIRAKSYAGDLKAEFKMQGEKLERIMGVCRKDQRGAAKDLSRARSVGRKIKRNLNRMQGTLEKGSRLMSKSATTKYLKFFAHQKHLFIYGKEGRGRFLDAEANDLVEKCDMIMTINPKYKFLSKRLDEIIVKEPNYL